MNFNQHAAGGVIVGLGVSAIAIGTGVVQVQHDLIMIAGVFGLTVFMAFFPDVDVASIPQRWFFRGVLLLLGWLYFSGNMAGFVLVSFLSPLPLIHKHRGWTHWKITPWMIVVCLVILLEYEKTRTLGDWNFYWKHGDALVREYWIYGLACVAGHYTHLLLDAYPMPEKHKKGKFC